jgi:phage-related protein
MGIENCSRLWKVSKEYFKKLVGTDDIWEIRIKFGRDIFRILCFFDDGKIIVLTNGFVKKSQKTPWSEIKLAERRKKRI